MDDSVGLELKMEDVKAQFLKQYRERGLPPLPDGPYLERMNAMKLAQAIESEVNRAEAVGHKKIRIDMDFADAIALASHLRRSVLLGA